MTTLTAHQGGFCMPALPHLTHPDPTDTPASSGTSDFGTRPRTKSTTTDSEV